MNKLFDQVLQESYKDKNGWNTRKLTRWWSGDRPVGKRAEDIKDWVDNCFQGLVRENRDSFDNVEEFFYMTHPDGDGRKYKVMLINKGHIYELFIDNMDTKEIEIEWRTDSVEHAGAMMEYLFGDL